MHDGLPAVPDEVRSGESSEEHLLLHAGAIYELVTELFPVDHDTSDVALELNDNPFAQRLWQGSFDQILSESAPARRDYLRSYRVTLSAPSPTDQCAEREDRRVATCLSSRTVHVFPATVLEVFATCQRGKGQPIATIYEAHLRAEGKHFKTPWTLSLDPKLFYRSRLPDLLAFVKEYYVCVDGGAHEVLAPAASPPESGSGETVGSP